MLIEANANPATRPAAPSKSSQEMSLAQKVQQCTRRYLDDMGHTPTENLYQMMLGEVEPPLIREVLRHTGGNRSKAAAILGMTRATLRKKIIRYDIE